MARILDNPKATNQQLAAAKVLSALLEQMAFSVGTWSSRRAGAGSDDD
jgi:hypothetical protein